MPEHVVSDMAIVIEHLSTFLPTQLVANSGAGLSYALTAMVELIRRGKVCKNQLVRDSMGKVLERMLDNEQHPSTADLATSAKDALLSGDQPETVKGLMLTYVELGKVLDTDGEVFDKNAARAGLARLIELVLGRGPNDELSMPAGTLVKSVGPVWQAFCDTLISECIFLFQDATGRLGDLRGMQKEMENAIEWASQDADVQRDRMGHYKSLQNAARGFLSMAVDALSMLLLLSNNAELCAAVSQFLYFHSSLLHFHSISLHLSGLHA